MTEPQHYRLVLLVWMISESTHKSQLMQTREWLQIILHITFNNRRKIIENWLFLEE